MAQSRGVRRLNQLFGNGGCSDIDHLKSPCNTPDGCETWHDEHPMVAMEFEEFAQLLKPYFEVHIFEHDYGKIEPWDGESGNALFVCVKA